MTYPGDPILTPQGRLSDDQPRLNASLQALAEAGALALGSNTSHASASVKTADFTITEPGVYLVDATAGAVAVTLPDAAGFSRKLLMVVKVDASGNAVTLNRAGSDTIEGATSLALSTQWAKGALWSYGTAAFLKWPGSA